MREDFSFLLLLSSSCFYVCVVESILKSICDMRFGVEVSTLFFSSNSHLLELNFFFCCW